LRSLLPIFLDPSGWLLTWDLGHVSTDGSSVPTVRGKVPTGRQPQKSGSHALGGGAVMVPRIARRIGLPCVVKRLDCDKGGPGACQFRIHLIWIDRL